MRTMHGLALSLLAVTLVAGQANAQVPGAPNGPPITGKVVAAPRPDAWRYQFHKGHWWYYQPDNTWLLWNGSVWTAYSGLEAGIAGRPAPVDRVNPYSARYGSSYRNYGDALGFSGGYYGGNGGYYGP